VDYSISNCQNKTKGDDPQGNFLSSVVGQSCRAIVAWLLSIENGQEISNWIIYMGRGPVWLPVDGNIAQQHWSKSCPVYHHL